MNEYDAQNGNYLKVSQEALQDLYYDFARILILKGETDDESLKRSAGQPHSFKFKFNGRTAKDIFLSSPGDDNLLAINGYVEYSQLQAIDVPPDDQKVEALYISIDSCLLENPEIIQNKAIAIRHDEKDGAVFKADVHIEYSTRDGRSLRYMPRENEGTEDDRLRKLLDAYFEGLREFTIDEYEQLKKLLNFLDEAAHQRES